MAIAYRAGGSAPARTTSGTQTLTVSPSTNAGNFVIVVVGNSNTAASSWATSSASGLGATWSGPYLLPNVTGSTTTNGAVFFGYNCSGGNTSITLSNLPATSSAITSWGLFSGVKTNASPLSSTWATTLGSTGTVVTTGSVSYNSGDLVLGLAWCFAWLATPAPSFSTAGTATNIWTGNTGVGARSSWSSYAVASSSGSTTYTSEGVQATSQAVAGQMVFTAAPVVTLTGSGSASVVAGTATLTVTSGAVAITGTGTVTGSGSGTLLTIWPLTGQNVTAYTDEFTYTRTVVYPSSFPTTITLIGLGGVPAGQNFPIGSPIYLYDGAGGYLYGTITAYSGTTLTFSATSTTSPGITTLSTEVFINLGNITGSCTVSAFYPVTGSGSGTVTGTGTLTSFVPITGTGSASVTGSGSLTVTPPFVLTGSGSADTQGSGTLTSFLPITGTGTVSASGSATLTVIPPFNLAGTGTADLSGAGALYPFEPITGAGGFGTIGTGTVNAYVPVSGSGITSVSGSGVLTSFVPVTGQGSATVTGTASISSFLPLSGQGVISTLGNGQIVVYVHNGPGKVKGGILAPKVEGGTATVGSVRGAILSPSVMGDVKGPNVRGKVLAPGLTGDTQIKQ